MAEKRKITDADRVWNRACWSFDQMPDPRFREGDLALAALLLVDGYIQNGGVAHAFDLRPDELEAGLAAYAYFGLHELAAIIRAHDEGNTNAYNQQYYRFTNKDNAIMAKFKEMYAGRPDRFATLNEDEGRS